MDESKGDPPPPQTWIVAVFVSLTVFVILLGISLYLKYGKAAPDLVVVTQTSSRHIDLPAMDDVRRLLKTYQVFTTV